MEKSTERRVNMETETETETVGPGKSTKVFMVISVALIAFYFAYSYSTSVSQAQSGVTGDGYSTGQSTGYASGSPDGAGGSGGCCGGGGGGPQITKKATVSDGKQVVDMVVNNGWNPNTIKAKADLPLTIKLDVQQAGGCISALVFPQFNTGVRLTSGTKSTLELPAMKPGTYTYSCQMGMVNGQLIVE